MSVQKDIERVVDSMSLLMSFYKQYRPDHKRVFIPAASFKLITNNVEKAKACGFTVDGLTIKHSGFFIEPAPSA